MIYDQILVRYGEMSLKGKNRKIFVDQLRKNVRRALEDFPNIEIQAKRDRMHILLNEENMGEVKERLKKVFGIHSFSPVIKLEKDMERLKESAKRLFLDLDASGKTFKVSAKRADKTFPYTSDQINRTLGTYLLNQIPGLTVDVHHPDFDLQVEVRQEAIYVTCEVIKGAGGLPVGSSGKGMLMLSGGIDSPVAGYLAMKRGLKIEAVHFYSPPFTSERSKQKVIDICKKLAEICGEIPLHIVPFTEIQQTIHQKVPNNYSMTITRRMMLRLTDEIRKKQGGLAIVNGESLGQVASQTLESMFTINEVTDTPVLRPLVAMDKLEIIQIAKEIGTHDISILPYEDCCTIFAPAQPKTKPTREKANEYETLFDYRALMEKALAGIETIVVSSGEEPAEKTAFQELF
ncbi:MAG: tRNA 4-thiouridine(8) synthase ThiI [Caldibacillus debilis]|jgi:tRNA uracil 4-sulfurtransferase|uniref:Probable tRNA sulfurtransferase n=2 Tax=Caldibacillus debilis TaxID=301148 RepID=A0A420VG64_9BACI|nr:tRNA uracil 4-sulfurtransferase ThiI [Caldibacillus debilis]MBO2481158.1 tRNA 4-thiouridine(8) synthase ThiI [Bacillaceae bacterium]MBY6272997.1 tRNA 4-thiouridine(8) synthase ThiI [Bacillaceae bacterium]OUM85354.1 MAG: tRNA 4-thiouridine(8) synthase ThiI [Caldibacillus debilis]REJ17498.1 MAG: tRNA 4-thiouridine(8) synthase ThiI [Caldibacillus debilis]REJ31451.1 MAG: tRNA 4-thiouridine(8) synthase ThiI [Caldibacillus debilis]